MLIVMIMQEVVLRQNRTCCPPISYPPLLRVNQNLFGKGCCLAVASGTLSQGLRRTAVVDPGLALDVAITESEEAAGSDEGDVVSSLGSSAAVGGASTTEGEKEDGASSMFATTMQQAETRGEMSDLALRYRGPISRPRSRGGGAATGSVLPMVFLSGGGRTVYGTGCVGLTLIPEAAAGSGGETAASQAAAGGGRLPGPAIAALLRAAMGSERFSELDVQVIRRGAESGEPRFDEGGKDLPSG